MDQLTIRSLPLQGSVRLARLIKERVPNLTCRACGHRDFAMLEVPDEGYRTVLRREDEQNQMTMSQPLVTVVCTTCGYLEQFAEAVLDGAKSSDYGEDHTNG